LYIESTPSALFIRILHFVNIAFLFWLWVATFEQDVGGNDVEADAGDAIGALHAVVGGVTGATGATVTVARNMDGAVGAVYTIVGDVASVVDTMFETGVISDLPCVVVSGTSVTDDMAKGETPHSAEDATGTCCGVTCAEGAMCDVGVICVEWLGVIFDGVVGRTWGWNGHVEFPRRTNKMFHRYHSVQSLRMVDPHRLAYLVLSSIVH